MTVKIWWRECAAANPLRLIKQQLGDHQPASSPPSLLLSPPISFHVSLFLSLVTMADLLFLQKTDDCSSQFTIYNLFFWAGFCFCVGFNPAPRFSRRLSLQRSESCLDRLRWIRLEAATQLAVWKAASSCLTLQSFCLQAVISACERLLLTAALFVSARPHIPDCSPTPCSSSFYVSSAAM